MNSLDTDVATLPSVESELASATRYFGMRKYEAVEAACRRALHLRSDSATALLMLAEAAIHRGEPAEAVTSVRFALAIEPTNAIAHFTLGRALHLIGDARAAADSYRKAVSLRSSFALAHNNLALALCDLRDYEEAIAAGQAAIRLAPDNADANATVGWAFFKIRKLPEAEAALRAALSLNPNHYKAINALGGTLHMLGQSEEAASCFRRAVELEPNAVSGWQGLGSILISFGHFEEAEKCYLRVLDIAPDCGEAYSGLAICSKQIPAEFHLERMGDILGNAELPLGQRMSAGFALGKKLDDKGQYDDAFAAYQQANKLALELARLNRSIYDPGRHREEVDGLIEVFTERFFQNSVNSRNHSELPVFVVGLYRSGTTLTEQILSSHRDIFGAGELLDVIHLASEILPDLSGISSLSSQVLEREAGRHISFLSKKSSGSLRVVDKRPENIFLLGLIALLFPGARVINCHRDPRDNVLSCYFHSNQADLLGCASRYIQTERLADHWRRTLPLKMLDVQYEALVSDIEGQARRMISFLGLEWDPTCLSFFETERSVQTPSMWQVRQPIYASSVGRWKKYERHLQPILPMLVGRIEG
jgi:tetratricopeptide (TPR) repeat protein